MKQSALLTPDPLPFANLISLLPLLGASGSGGRISRRLEVLDETEYAAEGGGAAAAATAVTADGEGDPSPVEVKFDCISTSGLATVAPLAPAAPP